MRFVDQVAAPTSAPGLAPSAVVFLSASHGFVATTGGGLEIPKSGWQPPFVPARIQETRDGGTTWRTVWRGRHVALQRLVFAGRDALALGVRSNPPRGVMSDPRTGFAVASTDGGEHWRVVRAPIGVTTLVAAGSSILGFGRERLVRLDLPAARWRRLVAPPGLGTAVAFASARVGFAAGSCAGGEQLWRTGDGARSWTAIPGTCGQPYTSLEVADARMAVAFQLTPIAASRQRQVFRRSTDGGRTWPVIGKPVPGPFVTATSFAGPADGWGVEFDYSQGFYALRLIRTSDGGRSWSAPAPAPAPPTAFAGMGDLWAVDGVNGVVWLTTDGARTWHAVASRRQISVNAIDEESRGRIAVDTTLGTLASSDGRTWRPASTPPRWRGGLARIVQRTPGAEMHLIVAGRPVPRPPGTYTIGGAWFTSARSGIVASGDISGGDTRALMWRTRDGGRTWRRVPLPAGVDPESEAALAADTLVVDGGGGLYVTLDDGAHWSRFGALQFPNGGCIASRPGRAVWVWCARLILRSDDGGRSWSELRMREPGYGFSFVAVSDREAWMTRSTPAFDVSELWRSTDGGATWRRVGVGVDPTTAVGYRLPPYSMTP